jgi:hypothetical protein
LNEILRTERQQQTGRKHKHTANKCDSLQVYFVDVWAGASRKNKTQNANLENCLRKKVNKNVGEGMEDDFSLLGKSSLTSLERIHLTAFPQPPTFPFSERLEGVKKALNNDFPKQLLRRQRVVHGQCVLDKESDLKVLKKGVTRVMITCG